MAVAGVPERLGRGDLHRLVRAFHDAELAADEEVEGDGGQQDHERDDRGAAEGLDLVLAVEVPGGHGQHHRGARDERGHDDVGVAPQEDGVGEEGPDVVELRLMGAVVRRVADGVLHPRVGRNDEGRREHGPGGDQPDAGQVGLLRNAVPAEDPDPEERRLQEEGGEAFHGQRPTEHVAHQPRVGGPVHAELELLNESRDHADRHVDQEQRSEEAGQPAIRVVAVAVPRRLEQGDQEGQADGDRHEEEVVDARAGELPAGEFEAHGVSLPSLRTAESPSGEGDRGSTGGWAFISSSHHSPA